MRTLCKLYSLFTFALLLLPTSVCADLSSPHITVLDKQEKIESMLSKYSSRLQGHNIISFVDYSMPISEKRFFVYDMKEEKIIYSTFVGHSRYSGNLKPNDTSNTPNTRKTSIGLFRVGGQYIGRFGKSKKLHGLSDTNSNAYKRAIIVHSMPGFAFEDLYSWGCFTFFEEDVGIVFKYMSKGSYLLAVK